MGNEISSDVDMRGYRIRNLAAPTSNTDVARKAEVDGKVSKSGDTMTGPLSLLNGLKLLANALPTDEFGWLYADGAQHDIFFRDATTFRRMWHGGNNPASLVANGYQKLASGMIIQWGLLVDVQPNTIATITFPIAFPQVCLTAVATLDSSLTDIAPVVVNSLSQTGFYASHNASDKRIIRWIAIGW
jgi:hypothetical protein